MANRRVASAARVRRSGRVVARWRTRIGGRWWTIQLRTPLIHQGEAVDGLCHHELRLIELDARLGRERMRETLDHEVAHAAAPELKHDRIRAIARASRNAWRQFESRWFEGA